MSRSTLVSILGVLAIVGLGSTQAAAGEYCDCGYPTNRYHSYYAPPVHRYYYAPRAAYLTRGPRWDYSAAYYNPPVYAYYNRPRVYGHGYHHGPRVYGAAYGGYFYRARGWGWGWGWRRW